jgi:hypothetical protein
MSISDMKRFIAQHIEEVQDKSKLEQIVHIIEAETKTEVNMKQFFESAVSRYGDVLKKLAE